MFLRIIVPLFLFLLAFPAWADMSQEEYEHARSAFLFADRGNWGDAQLHASHTNDAAFTKLIAWQYFLAADSGAGFSEITQFISANPTWPEQKKLRIRAEQSLRDSAIPDDDIIAWFGSQSPITGAGKIALAEALSHKPNPDEENIAALVRDGWKNGDFDESQEAQIRQRYEKILGSADDLARVDRLLWEEKITPAKRLLPSLPVPSAALFKARIALMEDKKNAGQLVSQVPSSLKNDPGLLYERMRYRARKNDDAGVRAMLLAAPKVVPYPQKWWKQREKQVREAIDEGHYTQAVKLLANHGQSEGSEYADALWLSGWLHLEFQDQPKAAYDLFYRMFDHVKYPVSKARAAYWAARAAEKSGDANAAGGWYDSAAAYPTTFYGQLASIKRNGTAPLRIPAESGVSSDTTRAFETTELARAVKLSSELGENDLAGRMIAAMIESASDEQDAILAAALGRSIGHNYLSVRGAKKAHQQKNIVLLRLGYPSPPTPSDIAVERPLALAITRQESEFDSRAKSPSGALGMMQLLPGTARETAQKNGLGYDIARLYSPEYNWTLGSLYLDRMIGSYDGSYVMAIAAYNAGPGNVRNWARAFGTPGNTIDGAVLWIEKIPFSETRNYVQRVLENLQVYRYLETDGNSPKLLLGDDLVR